MSQIVPVQKDITNWLPQDDLEWLVSEKRRIQKNYPVEIREHEREKKYKLSYTSKKRPTVEKH